MINQPWCGARPPEMEIRFASMCQRLSIVLTWFGKFLGIQRKTVLYASKGRVPSFSSFSFSRPDTVLPRSVSMVGINIDLGVSSFPDAFLFHACFRSYVGWWLHREICVSHTVFSSATFRMMFLVSCRTISILSAVYVAGLFLMTLTTIPPLGLQPMYVQSGISFLHRIVFSKERCIFNEQPVMIRKLHC